MGYCKIKWKSTRETASMLPAYNSKYTQLIWWTKDT